MPDTQPTVNSLPAGSFRSLIRATEAGVPPPDDLAAINRLSQRALAPDEVFAFPCVPSTDQLDSYLTRMALSSLQNYAADASAGVALMNSHRTSPWYGGVELPLGRTYQGSVLTDETGQATALQAAGYMLRGYNPNPGKGPATDEVIRGIEAGVIFDLSIGFDTSRGGWYRCSICGADMYAGACPHYQGLHYDDAGNYQPGKQGRLAFAWVENAHLSEVSFVYDGATPGAGIVKAQRAVEAGLLERAVVAQLEDVYQVRLAHRHAVPDLSQIKAADAAKEGRMAEENPIVETVVEPVPAGGSFGAALFAALVHARVGKELSAANIELLRGVESTLTEAGDSLDEAATSLADFLAKFESDDQKNAMAELESRAKRITALETRATQAEARIPTLEAEASEGRQYRADLTQESLASGVRALGERFGPGGKRQTQPAVELEPKTARPRKNTSQYQA
jgi:hypothetical protein